MRKMMLCIAAIAITGFAGLLPFFGTDVGKLHPVEVLVVTAKGDGITVETDTGLHGAGITVEAAIENLRLTSAGEIFLDTANYLLLSGESVHLLNGFSGFLRPACQVYVYSGDGKWDNVAKYLESHPSNVTILGYKQGKTDVAKLSVHGEDYKIVES